MIYYWYPSDTFAAPVYTLYVTATDIHPKGSPGRSLVTNVSSGRLQYRQVTGGSCITIYC